MGPAGTCNQHIHPEAHLQRVAEQRQLGPQQLREFAQHLQRLPFFRDQRLPQFVAQLDGCGRLDEQRLRAGRLVVDNALGSRPEVAPHRNDIASAADGYGAFTGAARRVDAPEDAFEPAHQSLAGVLRFPARGGQGGTRSVEHLAIRRDGSFEPAVDVACGKIDSKRRCHRGRLADPPEFLAHPVCGGKHVCHGGQLHGIEHTALYPQAPERLRQLRHRLRLDPVTPAIEGGDFLDQREFRHDPGVVGRWPQPPHAFRAALAGGKGRDEIQHCRELDGLEGVGTQRIG